MSLNAVALKTYSEKDPLVDVENLDKRAYYVLNGGSMVSYQEFQSPNVSNSNIQLTTLVPDPSTIVDPKIYAKVQYRFDFTGTSSSGNLIQIGQSDCLCAFPFNTSCNVMTCAINGQTISSLVGQYLPALLRYGDYEKYNEEFSTTPQQLDQCQQFSDLAATNRSPFANFGDNTFEQSRGAFPLTIVSNTPTSATILADVYEPLFLPCLYYNNKGLVGIKNLNWNFTFSSLNKLWNHDAVNGNNIQSIAVNITRFSLVFKFITPSLLTQIPKSAVYRYNEFVPSFTLGSPVSAGQTAQLTMQALSLSAVPERIYIWVREQDADINTSYTKPVSFAVITNINIQYSNVTGLLASAPKEALYRIAVENGYNADYATWLRQGSVIGLRMGKDICMSSTVAPGVAGVNPNLSMTVQFYNPSSSTRTYQLSVFVMYEGVISIMDGSMNKSISVLSSSDVLNSQLQHAQPALLKDPKDFYGGSILDSAWQFGKDVVQTAKSGFQLGKDVAPLLGLGASSGGALSGGRKHRKKRGGALVDRDELSAQMDELEM